MEFKQNLLSMLQFEELKKHFVFQLDVVRVQHKTYIILSATID